MTTKTEVELYPEHSGDLRKLGEILDEVREALMTRSDGIKIVIVRDDQYPPMNGKPLISGVTIEAWDISA